MQGHRNWARGVSARALVEWVENDGSFGQAFSHGTMSAGEQRAFGLPDARVEAPPSEADRLLGELNVYQLAEEPVLVSGDTFRPDLDTPRRRLERRPADGYPPGHACHNPFGAWAPKGVRRIPGANVDPYSSPRWLPSSPLPRQRPVDASTAKRWNGSPAKVPA